jgi:hypothetical protein
MDDAEDSLLSRCMLVVMVVSMVVSMESQMQLAYKRLPNSLRPSRENRFLVTIQLKQR